MRTLATAVLCLMLSASALAADNTGRTYVSALSIGGEEALRFEIAAPRMSAGEFAKAIGSPEIRAALNERHLSDLGTLRASRAFLIGNRYLEKGAYSFAIFVRDDGKLEVILTNSAGIVRIPLESDSCQSAHVPQPSIAFLAREAIDQFDLEVRFGNLLGRTPLLFTTEDLISGMNNRAYELLVAGNGNAEMRREALRLALLASTMTEGRIPQILDTLALAQFSNGDVIRAIETQKQAIDIIGPASSKERLQFLAQLRHFEKAAGQTAAGRQ